MSEAALIEAGTDSSVGEYIEAASRCDGSRTPPHLHALVHLLSDKGESKHAIAKTTGMDHRTVTAILERRDHLVSDARALLTANALGFAGDAIKASEEAAKRGKLADILHLTDRLGITEPPKSSAQVQVNTQVILHGGSLPNELSAQTPAITVNATAIDAELRGETPDSSRSSRAVDGAVLPPALDLAPKSTPIEGLSPAKVSETSETGEIQAGNSEGLIMPLKSTVAASPQVASGQSVSAHSSAAKVIAQVVAPAAAVGGKA